VGGLESTGVLGEGGLGIVYVAFANEARWLAHFAQPALAEVRPFRQGIRTAHGVLPFCERPTLNFLRQECR